MTERPTHTPEHGHTHDNKKDEKMHHTQTHEQKKEEKKVEITKQETKKIEKKPKKNSALVNGRNLSISTKEAVAVCNYIRNKDVDKALSDLELVTLYKRAVPMRGEIPHRHGNMMAGRYPMNTVHVFIGLLKSLKSNAIMHELELEKFKIFCMAHQASRPYKRFGAGKIKRSNVEIRLLPRTTIDGGKN